MAGILDSKTRILDTIVTQEGRRQLASGDFQVEFVTFTDGATFYQASVASGSADAGARIYFEATSNPKDSIVIERDLNGNLFYFDGSDVRVLGESILSGSSVLTGSDFKSHIPALVKSTPRHFNDLYALKTKDPFGIDALLAKIARIRAETQERNDKMWMSEVRKWVSAKGWKNDSDPDVTKSVDVVKEITEYPLERVEKEEKEEDETE